MGIYADNAATTKMSRRAIEAMLPYLDGTYGNPSSPHSAGRAAADAMEAARERIAALLRCSPRELIFTSGGSEADNQAILSAARAGLRAGKRHIVASAIEHHAVLRTLERLAEEGFRVTLLPVNREGFVSPDTVAEAIGPDTALVSVMYVNNEVGTVQPIAEIGALCRERGVPFHSDMVQAPGYLPLDLGALPVDLAAFSAHKFHGPKGAGLLYARRGAPLESLLLGGAQERGNRAGTENLPAIVAMAAALEEAAAQREETAARLTALQNALIDGLLAALPHAALNGGRGPRHPGNVNLCIEGVEAEALLLLLDGRGICASAGAACAAGAMELSHVLLAMGLPRELARASIRLSLDRENTAEDVTTLLREIPSAAEHLRSLSPAWQEKTRGLRQFLL